jgi:hypothetical protein
MESSKIALPVVKLPARIAVFRESDYGIITKFRAVAALGRILP